MHICMSRKICSTSREISSVAFGKPRQIPVPPSCLIRVSAESCRVLPRVAECCRVLQLCWAALTQAVFVVQRTEGLYNYIMYVISQFTDHDNTTMNTFVVKIFLFIKCKIKITLYNPDSTTGIKMILQLDILVCKK